MRFALDDGWMRFAQDDVPPRPPRPPRFKLLRSLAVQGSSLAAMSLASILDAQTPVPTVALRSGMVITQSVRIAPRVYKFAGPQKLDSALVIIRGNNVTVDFAGATMQGVEPGTNPDEAAGVAVRIEGGSNVRIVNARIRGYRFGIMALGTRNLRIEDSNLSDNWKPRLFSLIEHESLVDWMSYHKNEKDEWLRFGAAIYLDGVRGGEIRGVRAEQGINGLMMSRTDSVRVWNNVLSFNSGLGIALYRSSYNTIVHNYVNFNVRGYSHGKYRRGQDSAGILVYEQSEHNVFAYNAVTHGGDGLFLWAGQSTMDTGRGGANDNLVYGNDFSYAPTNGIETTFSRNIFVNNRVVGNDHGVWGGYSYSSLFAGNTFRLNRIGMAIEHGQDNTISANSFDGDSTAISLWANRIEPSDWGYPKFRDTRSRNVSVADNLFQRHRVGVRARWTTNVQLRRNAFAQADSAFVLDDTTRAATVVDSSSVGRRDSIVAQLAARYAPAKMPGGLDPTKSPAAQMDRSAIIIDEWGPYDWRSPRLWPADSTRAYPMRLRVLGPAGTWQISGSRGVTSASPRAGRFGDTIVVTPAIGSLGDWTVILIDDASKRAFSYERFEPRMVWRAKLYDTTPDSALKAPDMARLSAWPRTPMVDTTLTRLDYMWYRPTVARIPRERWALDATTTVTLADGVYTLRTISDDGIRVWVDGTLVIDNWTSHESVVNNVPLAPGPHDIRVHYWQGGGWTELRVEIVKGKQTSIGSAGPH